jgi:hypothetical protein
MTHHDAGHYHAKHPDDQKSDEIIAEAVKKKTVDGEISCTGAESIADDLGVDMRKVGVAVDLLDIRLNRCQLGLFGYHPEKIIVKPAATIGVDLEKAVRDALINGRLPCAAAWEIARRLHIPRMDVSSTCEGLGIKVKPCQLGAF